MIEWQRLARQLAIALGVVFAPWMLLSIVGTQAMPSAAPAGIYVLMVLLGVVGYVIAWFQNAAGGVVLLIAAAGLAMIGLTFPGTGGPGVALTLGGPYAVLGLLFFVAEGAPRTAGPSSKS